MGQAMISEDKKKVVELFNAGRRLYKLMEFGQARDVFIAALDVDPQDGPSRVYLERCDHYVACPPPEDWDGVFVMKTK